MLACIEYASWYYIYFIFLFFSYFCPFCSLNMNISNTHAELFSLRIALGAVIPKFKGSEGGGGGNVSGFFGLICNKHVSPRLRFFFFHVLFLHSPFSVLCFGFMPSRRFSVYHFTQCRMRFWFSLHCSIVGIICWKKKVRHSRGMFCSGFKVLEIVLLPSNKIVFLSSLKCTHTHQMKTFYSEVSSITFDAVFGSGWRIRSMRTGQRSWLHGTQWKWIHGCMNRLTTSRFTNGSRNIIIVIRFDKHPD